MLELFKEFEKCLFKMLQIFCLLRVGVVFVRNVSSFLIFKKFVKNVEIINKSLMKNV